MDTTKPETLPLFTSLAKAGWTVETGYFGCNGNTVKLSDDYRLGLRSDGGSRLECRQLRVSKPGLKGFYVVFDQPGDETIFSVQIIAGRGHGLKLGRTYFYPGSLDAVACDSEDVFIDFINAAYDDVYLQEFRSKIATVEAFLAGLERA